MLVSDYLGRKAYDRDGHEIGRIEDLIVTAPPDDYPVITHVLICRRRTRLFGYERQEITGPWIIEKLARWIQGPVRELPLAEIRLTQDVR